MSEKVKLSEVVAISGYSGLHKVVSRGKNVIVVESIDENKKRMSVPPSNKVSMLSDIAMFSKTEDVKLGNILENIYNNKISVPTKKADDKDLKSFMQLALPDFDETRVYNSHIEKLARWAEILQNKVDPESLVEKEEPEAEVKTEEVKTEVETPAE